MRVSSQILELREARNEYDNVVESKIRDHIHRMETLELNKSAEIDILREDQFEQVSRSLNGLTQKVDCLRKKRSVGCKSPGTACLPPFPLPPFTLCRKSILACFKEELANGRFIEGWLTVF